MSLQRAVLRFRRPTSWTTRAVLAVLAADAVAALLGMWVVPAILRWPAGLGAMLGAVGAQFAIAVAAVFGPMSVDKRPRTAGICLALGTLFAVTYVDPALSPPGSRRLDLVSPPTGCRPSG